MERENPPTAPVEAPRTGRMLPLARAVFLALALAFSVAAALGLVAAAVGAGLGALAILAVIPLALGVVLLIGNLRRGRRPAP